MAASHRGGDRQALAHLDVEGLLDELFRRLAELLDIDTAAVLLLDEDTNELVPTATRGIEAEVRQGYGSRSAKASPEQSWPASSRRLSSTSTRRMSSTPS